MEEFSIVAGVVFFVVTVSGTIGVISYESEQQTLQCIQQVHDKPAIEINSICKK